SFGGSERRIFLIPIITRVDPNENLPLLDARRFAFFICFSVLRTDRRRPGDGNLRLALGPVVARLACYGAYRCSATRSRRAFKNRLRRPQLRGPCRGTGQRGASGALDLPQASVLPHRAGWAHRSDELFPARGTRR